jgi:phosphate-selective porin
MKYRVAKRRIMAACGFFVLGSAGAAAQDSAELTEIRLLKARLKQIEDRVAAQGRQQKVSHAEVKATHAEVKANNLAVDNKLKRLAFGPNTTSSGPVTSTTGHWYEHLSLRGYTQGRFNSMLSGDRDLTRLPGDRSVGRGQNFLIRRARVILSGDVSDNLYVYVQPDFASTPTGSTTSNFAQLRDAYGDIYFDKAKEFRVRAGQSKIPFSFENMQSSQNRLALDRNDSLNSCCRDERDIGLFFYYTPKHLRPVFRDLVKNNLKGSGDYGMFALGVYNGQGANRLETNNELHVVSRFTYPYTFSNGQIVEAGIQGYAGRFSPTTAAIGGRTPTLRTDAQGFRDERVGLHAVLYPQPFGIQAEWNWGNGPSLNAAQNGIEVRSLNGGYIQASYKYEDHTFGSGTYFPFVKWQYFNGASKFETNAPMNRVNDLEFGVEWQPRPELEFTAVYAKVNRTNLFTAPYRQFQADVLRTQLQWNY